MINLDTFKKILRCTQPELKETVQQFLTTKGFKPVVGDGFVYAKGEIPILLVAHLDTVHKQIPTDIYYDSEQDVMWSPQGIGGDDRCGVYIILKILENFKPYVLFTEDEEKGCIGATKTVSTIIQPDVKFIVEVDRRGSDDCVFYDCDNKDFQAYIETFGFKTAIGTYSDIVTLSDEWEIASVNLSSGYYREHTTNEIIKINELEETYNRLKDILLDDENNKISFDYQKKKYIPQAPYKPEKASKKKKKYRYGDGEEYEDGWGYIGKDGNYHFWEDEEDPYDWDYKDDDLLD